MALDQQQVEYSCRQHPLDVERDSALFLMRVTNELSLCPAVLTNYVHPPSRLLSPSLILYQLKFRGHYENLELKMKLFSVM